ncbi:hypothetical protein KCP78_09830 [Salmonella enterica subsp. enterica]|nr:hypothetical protein KCP78_09830 [Salmonella enterica subsp. enterica]
MRPISHKFSDLINPDVRGAETPNVRYYRDFSARYQRPALLMVNFVGGAFDVAT